MIEVSDYVHISDNDGKFDQNRRLKEGSEMHELLKSASTSGKICTIEVYDGIESLHETHDLLIEL